MRTSATEPAPMPIILQSSTGGLMINRTNISRVLFILALVLVAIESRAAAAAVNDAQAAPCSTFAVNV